MNTSPRFRSSILLVLTAFAAIPTASLSQDAAEARKAISKPNPQLPAIAKSMRISGSVRLDALVAPNGNVKSIEIKGGHPVLAQAAAAAVIQWKYVTAAHETHESVEIKFDPQ